MTNNDIKKVAYKTISKTFPMIHIQHKTKRYVTEKQINKHYIEKSAEFYLKFSATQHGSVSITNYTNGMKRNLI